MSIGPPSPNVALVTKLVAKPDEADAVSTFLADAVRLASQEQGTIAWFRCAPTRPPSGLCFRRIPEGLIAHLESGSIIGNVVLDNRTGR
jgi:hypothetical protein